MKKTWMSRIRRRISAALVCSMLITQFGAAAPGTVMAAEEAGEEAAETVTLRGRIVSLAKGYDVTEDIDLRLYVNGRPDTSRRPLFVKAEDSREPFDLYDDAIELINDLDVSSDGADYASASDAGYDVWEYRFEGLPFEDADGNEYEYTIRDMARAAASPSNMASSSDLATPGHAERDMDALYWTDMEGTKVLKVNGAEFPAAGARLVYVPYTDVEGAYVFEDSEGRDPEQVTLELGCVQEADEAFLEACGGIDFSDAGDSGEGLSSGMEAVLDADKGRWSLEHVPQYNPLTCAEIDYQVTAVSGYEDYRIRYENRGKYAGREDYACDGGTIFHEAIAEETAVTYSVRGTVAWDDRDDEWGLRPETADFLQVYDAEGNDVTGQMDIWAEGTDTDTWTYTIDGLTEGESYILDQNLPAYDAEGLTRTLILSEGKSAGDVAGEAAQGLARSSGNLVTEVPEIRESLRRGSVRGLIRLSEYNPVVRAVDFAELLHVYAGTAEVTDRVDIDVAEVNAGGFSAGGYRVYTVDGLPEGRQFSIRADKPDGYAVVPSEISVTAGIGGYLRSRLAPGQPEIFTLLLERTVELTIENIYHDGGSDGETRTFSYELKTGDAKGTLAPYSGFYTLIDKETGKSEGTQTTDGTIHMSENQKAVIKLSAGKYYSAKQMKEGQEDEFVVLYGGENPRTKQISEDAGETFINIKYQLKQYRKRWNDNGSQNGSAVRPSSTELLEALELAVTDASGKPLDQGEKGRLGLADPSAAIDTGLGANEWAIVYEKMPMTDKDGNALSYDLTEKPMAGYKTTYEQDEVYDKAIVNTSYMTFEATILWLDSKNEGYRFASAETFKKHLELYRSDSAGGEDKLISFDEENDESTVPENHIVVEGEADGLFWDVKIENLVEYDDQGLPYTYYLKEKTDADGTIKTEDSKAWYVPTCTNLVNYFNEKEKCYDEGFITNLLQGETEVGFTKLWKDGEADITETPGMTFQLMRYPSSLDPAAGYAQASSVETKTAAELGGAGKKLTGQIIWGEKTPGGGISPTAFPRFDANGEEYVYFIREILSGINSEEYVQKITAADGGESFFAKTGLDLVANGETLTNKREGWVGIPVTKTWKSAAYQNIDAKVELKVMRRSQNPKDTGWQTMLPDYFPDKKDPVITGFSAETLTMSAVIDKLFKYDDDGYLYEYQVGENRIWLRTDKTRALHPDDEDAQYVELAKEETKAEDGSTDSLVFKTTQEHFDGNRQYKFRAETEKDGDTGWKITNTLENDIEIRVDKHWTGNWAAVNPLNYPVKLSFALFRDGTSLAAETLEKPDIKPLITGGIQEIPFTNPADGGQNKWPRYDENGKEYAYSITETVDAEGSVGRITYKYNWETGEWASADSKESSKADDAWVTKVSNPPPGKGADIEIEKIWLDGGDLPHREPVEVTLYTKGAGGSWEKTDKKTVLTEEDGWKGYISVSDTENTIEHPESYMVVETALLRENDRHTVVYDPDNFIQEESGRNTASGTVKTEYHTYTVTNSYAAGKCTITNLRTGLVDVAVTKEWKDGVDEDPAQTAGDVTDGHRPASATFQLMQNGKAYAEANADSNRNPNPQTTATNRSQTQEHAQPLIQWTDLPKYDKMGELYSYTVEETEIGNADATSGGADFTDKAGVLHHYSSSIIAKPYEHSSVNPDTGVKTNDRIPFHAVNERNQERTIKIYKYWKDDGPNKSPRADVYFSLMRSVNGGATLEPAIEAGKAIKNDSYAPPTGYENQKDNWFEYVFDSAPRYDEEGREYTYYLSEGMNGNSSKYKPYYYDEEPQDITDATPPIKDADKVVAGSGNNAISWYPMPDDTATVVNIREDSVKVTGKKIWDNMGGLKKENGDFPALKLELQVKHLDEAGDPYRDVTDSATGNAYTCTLPDSSGSYEYQFDGPSADDGFPKYDEATGQELTYRVAEKTVGGTDLESLGYYERTSDEKSFVIKNTYRGDTSYQVELVKRWADVPVDVKSSQTKEGPTITVELWRVMTKLDGSGKTEIIPYTAEKVKSKTVKYSESSGNQNTVSFENLAKTAPTMQPYLYYLKETKLNGYESSLAEQDADTNMWVTPENDWFTLDQNLVSKEITNTYVPSTEEVDEIKGDKEWSYTGNQEALTLAPEARTTGITINLYRRYVNSETGLSAEEKVEADFAWTDAANTPGDTSAPWEYSFTPKTPAIGFPKYAPNGTEYSYFVRETIGDEDLKKLYGTGGDSKGLTVSEMNAGSGQSNLLTVTNKLQTAELKVTKKWEDSRNLYKTRPADITLTVERRAKGDASANWSEYQVGGTTVTLKVTGDETAESWTADVKDLPKYSCTAGGSPALTEYEYRAAETTVPAGYTHDSSADQHGKESGGSQAYISSITNTVENKGISITAEKIWDDDNDTDGLRGKTKAYAELWRKAAGADEGTAEKVDSVQLLESPDAAEQNPKPGVIRSDSTVTWEKLPTYMPNDASDTPKTAEYFIRETMEGDGAAFYQQPKIKAPTGTPSNWQITNRHSQITDIQVTFTKKWEDQNNKWKTRPDSISVVLLRKAGSNGAEEVVYNELQSGTARPQTAVIDADAAGSWSTVFTYLPYAAGGRPYTYFVKEGTVKDGKFVPSDLKGYKPFAESDITVFTPDITSDPESHKGSVSLTNRLDTIDIQAKKQWSDDNDRYGTRPDSVRFELYRKAGKSASYEKVSSEKLPGENSPAAPIVITREEFKAGAAEPGNQNFKLKYENLPKTDMEGNEYIYQIRETAMIFGSGIDEREYKVPWNEDGTPADDIVGGYQVTVGTSAGTPVITNTLVTASPIRVEKAWDDQNNQDGIREINPANIKVTLYRTTDPEADQKTDISKLVSMGEKPLAESTDGQKTWYAEWENLPLKSPGGETYRYLAVEALPQKSVYKVSYEPEKAVEGKKNQDVTITMTNSYTPKTMRVEAVKVWAGDDDGAESQRPDTVLLGLYKKTADDTNPMPVTDQSGKPLQKSVGARQQWRAEWNALPVCSGGGEKITYYVKEELDIPGYKSSYGNGKAGTTSGTGFETAGVSGDMSADSGSGANAATITITNTWDTRSIYAKKVWKDEDNRDGLRKDIVLRLLGDGSPVTGQDDKTIGKNGDGLVSWSGLPVTNSAGERIAYSVQEVTALDGYTTVYAGNASGKGLAADPDNNGASAATPLLVTNTHQAEKTTYTIEKLWLGDEAWKDEVRPDSIQVQLYSSEGNQKESGTSGKAVGSPVTVVPDGDGRWTYTWMDLYKYWGEGREIRYYAREIDVDGYRSTASGSNAIVNTLVTGSLEVVKTLKGGAATDFEFRVELTVDGTDTIVKEYTIRSGDKIRIDGIPEGTFYKVTEMEKNGYRLETVTGDTGVIEENKTARAEFVNRKKSSGGGGGGDNGGGGGGNTPNNPVNPEDPSGQVSPEGPGVPTPAMPSEPEPPMESATITLPSEPTLPDIPVTPDRRPDVLKGTTVEVRDPGDPDGPPVYRGSYTGRFEDMPAGRYLLVTLDDEGVPLANLLIYIDDAGVPLALPKTGDTGIPVALQVFALLGSLAGILFLRRRKKGE